LGKQWGSIEDVAGGDTLRLEFNFPVSSVKVGSTSNYEPGLKDPDGKPIANYDVVSESSAVSTADPAVWLTTLPPLDARAISTQGYTFSVVAQDGSGDHDFPFGIRAPRWADESAKCGAAFYNTGWQQYVCGNDFPKAPRPGHFRVSRATYTGSIVTLKVDVPAAGKLRLGIPRTCGGRSRSCHRRAWVARNAKRRGSLVIRKTVSLRLPADNRMKVWLHFASIDGVRSKISKVKVHLTSPAAWTQPRLGGA
jgi:hypothetical protein